MNICQRPTTKVIRAFMHFFIWHESKPARGWARCHGTADPTFENEHPVPWDSSTPPKWLGFALQSPKPGELLSDVALLHWNYLLFHTGVAWRVFCHFVPGPKTSSFPLLITLAYHSDVYFLVIFTIVSLWRTKPCTRNSLLTETFNTKDLVYSLSTDKLKKAKLKSAHYTFVVLGSNGRGGEQQTRSTFPFERMLFTIKIHFF